MSKMLRRGLKILAYAHAHDCTQQDAAEALGYHKHTARRYAATAKTVAEAFPTKEHSMDVPTDGTYQRLLAQLERATDVETLPPPWELDLDRVTLCADVHVPSTSAEWTDKMVRLSQAWDIKTLIIAGDFTTSDIFSSYDKVAKQPSWRQERDAGRAFFELVLEWFDAVYVLNGNHDQRAAKKTQGEFSNEFVIDLFTADKRVQVHERDNMTLISGGIEWLVAHGRNYSAKPSNVGEKYVTKHRKNVASAHEHHGTLTQDRYKWNWHMGMPALGEDEKMVYRQTSTNTASPGTYGFAVIRDGYPYLFADGVGDLDLMMRLGG